MRVKRHVSSPAQCREKLRSDARPEGSAQGAVSVKAKTTALRLVAVCANNCAERRKTQPLEPACCGARSSKRDVLFWARNPAQNHANRDQTARQSGATEERSASNSCRSVAIIANRLGCAPRNKAYQ